MIPEVYVQLGAAFFLGEDVPQDFQSAYFYFTLAALHGSENVVLARQEAAKNLTPGQIADIDLRAAARMALTVARSLVLAAVLVFSTPALAGAVTMEDAFSPHQGATELVVRTINEARKSIHVAAYSFTSKPIAAALVAAHDSGLDVEIVLDKSQADGRMTRYLAGHGVPIRINYRYSIMHDKFMVIDGTTLELGSFNYTAAAENKNAENVLVIRNAAQVIEDYGRQWQKLWSEAE